MLKKHFNIQGPNTSLTVQQWAHPAAAPPNPHENRPPQYDIFSPWQTIPLAFQHQKSMPCWNFWACTQGGHVSPVCIHRTWVKSEPCKAPFVSPPPGFSWRRNCHDNPGEGETPNMLAGTMAVLQAYGCLWTIAPTPGNGGSLAMSADPGSTTPRVVMRQSQDRHCCHTMSLAVRGPPDLYLAP